MVLNRRGRGDEQRWNRGARLESWNGSHQQLSRVTKLELDKVKYKQVSRPYFDYLIVDCVIVPFLLFKDAFILPRSSKDSESNSDPRFLKVQNQSFNGPAVQFGCNLFFAFVRGCRLKYRRHISII